MSVSEHLWRFPKREAIVRLAERFTLPATPQMQDWEWEVADPARIDEFLAAYGDPALSDDERFVLAEMLLQSFEDSPGALDDQPRWAEFLGVLEHNITLHIHSVWYWAALEGEARWRISPDLRDILRRHRGRFDAVPRGAV